MTNNGGWGWGVSFGGDGNVLKLHRTDGRATLMNEPTVTELNVLNGYILWYMNYITIKLFLRKDLEEVKVTHVFLLSGTHVLYPTMGEEKPSSLFSYALKSYRT